VNVETTLCGGDLFRIRNGGQIMCLATVRPVTATPMAAGLVMNATQDALGMINSASTIQGAGAVDVKAGGTGAVTFATLAGTRTSDAALFATVVAGTTV
jgi:hypothetical protein